MKPATQRICVLAVGIALFAALSLCLQVPVFENYYLCLGYAVMAVYCYSFGAFSGAVVGALGVVAYCLVISGLRGMPGWALGNVLIGILLGFTFRRTKAMKNPALKTALNISAIVISSALGILIVKSLTECLLYSQPMLVRIGKNMSAFIADAVMLVISLPICAVLDQPVRKMFPRLVK